MLKLHSIVALSIPSNPWASSIFVCLLPLCVTNIHTCFPFESLQARKRDQLDIEKREAIGKLSSAVRVYPAATPLLNVLSALFLHLLRSNMRFLVSSLSCPVAECITLNPQYKPPVGYKPVLKEARLYIPVSSSNVFSHFHVIRAFLIAPLPSPVFDMSCVCRVSRRFLASKTFRLIPLVFKWPLCRFVMRQPVNVIGSQVGCL